VLSSQSDPGDSSSAVARDALKLETSEKLLWQPVIHGYSRTASLRHIKVSLYSVVVPNIHLVCALRAASSP